MVGSVHEEMPLLHFQAETVAQGRLQCVLKLVVYVNKPQADINAPEPQGTHWESQPFVAPSTGMTHPVN